MSQLVHLDTTITMVFVICVPQTAKLVLRPQTVPNVAMGSILMMENVLNVHIQLAKLVTVQVA